MKGPQNIKIADYDYDLPLERIAQHPLAERDASKLLVYRDGEIYESTFRDLASLLPAGSRLIFNETKVIPARLVIHKPTGARIEIFCLEPAGQVTDYQLALSHGPGCDWKCLVGNAKRWKEDTLEVDLSSEGKTLKLQAQKILRMEDHFIIRFDWEDRTITFSEILDMAGKVPLPPYIHREADEVDRERYQTVFAREAGSIAAPTAGLHFTENILEQLHNRGISTHAINLHVGAGTFKPVSSETLAGHTMHTEFVSVPQELIRQLIEVPATMNILVGTTTVRTIESLYWQGVKWMRNTPDEIKMDIGQWDPYSIPDDEHPPLQAALKKVADVMQKNHMSSLSGYTSLMIAPGYKYKVPGAIITNFHMPQSTLLLLISAFIGDDWRKAYQFAMENAFRFLSYGDSCLLFKNSTL